MAVITAIAATTIAVGATVAGGIAQKKGAKKAGEAFKNVGRGIEKMDRLESSIRQLMGVSKDEENTNKDSYALLRDKSTKIVSDQMEGQLSEATRTMLGRRAIATGATGLGRGAVQDAYTGYLGLTTEDTVNQGFVNYRNMFSQLSSTAQQQQAQTYNMQYNSASAQAASIQNQANATAGMFQGIASIAGGVAGAAIGGMGGGGGAGGAGGAARGASGMFGAGTMAGGGAQPSGAYFSAMAQAGRNPGI